MGADRAINPGIASCGPQQAFCRRLFEGRIPRLSDDYEFYDTLCASRRVLPDLENHQLHTVAAAYGYCLEDHHHALADAEACAWIAREIL